MILGHTLLLIESNKIKEMAMATVLSSEVLF